MIRHTVDGRPAATIEDLAQIHGRPASSIRTIIAREAEAGRPLPVLDRCGSKALYDPKVFARALANRPGRGAAGVPRSRTDAT